MLLSFACSILLSSYGYIQLRNNIHGLMNSLYQWETIIEYDKKDFQESRMSCCNQNKVGFKHSFL